MMPPPKVAFVEWDTKVPIWRYEGVPSYRYDTTSVVDATAFGANATAMEGCLVGVEPFVRAGQRDELIAFLNTQDVVFLVSRYHWAELGELAQELQPMTILGFGMGLDQMREGMQRDGGYEALLALCQAVTLVAVFAEELVPYLRLLTTLPVEYLPMCYPYGYVRDTYRIPPAQRQPVVAVPGNVWNAEIGGRRDDLCSAVIAYELVRNRAGWSVRLSDRKLHRSECAQASQLPFQVRDRQTAQAVTERIESRLAMSWESFLQWMRGSALSLHCDWTWTTGRMAADMAALGIPHLGGNSDHTKHLFPDLCFDEFDVDSMLTRANMILDNPALAARLIEIADLWGEQLDYSNWRQWFERLVETYRV